MTLYPILHKHTYTLSHTHTYVHTRSYIHTHTYIHIYAHIYIYIYIIQIYDIFVQNSNINKNIHIQGC